MNRRVGRPSPAMLVAMVALFVALGGTVYAAAGKINGKAIKVKSLPGNRLKPKSVPADRLQPGAISGSQLQPGSITGRQIDMATLGVVPIAQYAETAKSALDAQTALNAVNAINANTVNGHGAGCLPGTQLFAGSCWQSSPSEATLSAPNAAIACGALGGMLPEAMELVAFSKQTGVALDAGGEWSDDVLSFTGPNLYAVATVFPNSVLDSALSTSLKKYRCVIPLVT